MLNYKLTLVFIAPTFLFACADTVETIDAGSTDSGTMGQDGAASDAAGDTSADVGADRIADAADDVVTQPDAASGDASTDAPPPVCNPSSDCSGDGVPDGFCNGDVCLEACRETSECAHLNDDCRQWQCLIGVCVPSETEPGCSCSDAVECVGLGNRCYTGVCEAGACAGQHVDRLCDETSMICTDRPQLMQPGVPALGYFRRSELAVGTARLCGGVQRYIALDITETSDVILDVEIDQPDMVRIDGEEPCELACSVDIGVPLPPTCCEPLYYIARLESECGVPESDVIVHSPGHCQASGADVSFPWNGVAKYFAPAVAPGRYFVVIDAAPGSRERPFSVTAEVSPTPAVVCDGAELSTDRSVAGTTALGVDALTSECNTIWEAARAPERIHPFEVAERSRVRVTVSAPDERLRLRLLSGCDSTAEFTCQRTSCTGGDAIEEVLDPGTYYVAVEVGSSRPTAPNVFEEAGSVDYGIDLRVEPVNLACSGATVIRSTATLSGDTSMDVDRVWLPRRYASHCGDTGLGRAPESVYSLVLTEPSVVSLDLVTGFEDAALTLYEGCGETLIAGGARSTAFVRTLAAGTYSLFVGGGVLESEGPFSLDVTIAPTP